MLPVTKFIVLCMPPFAAKRPAFGIWVQGCETCQPGRVCYVRHNVLSGRCGIEVESADAIGIE